MTATATRQISPAALVALVCTAGILVQIGAFTWPALLPTLMPLWQLTNTEAGWATSAFYGAYLVSVPVLVTLTDRIDAKAVYLFGVALTVVSHTAMALLADGLTMAIVARALAGIGWAGTYMTGLKLLADRVDARLMSRAVAGHAAGLGIAGALSFVMADLLAGPLGWRGAFAVAAACAGVAWLAVFALVPWRGTRPAVPAGALFDFRPVFRNRSAMAYAIAYAIHTLEMSVVRGWGVVFLGFVAASTGVAGGWLTPALALTLLALFGTVTSVIGNELSIRLGRRRLIAVAMAASVLFALLIGFAGSQAYWLAALLLVLYGPVIWLDSSSLTAGAAGSAAPDRRGATLAIHSMLGYGGGFVGPILFGLVLDAAGGQSATAWAIAFAGVAGLMLLALIVFLALRPRGLPGDAGEAPRPVAR